LHSVLWWGLDLLLFLFFFGEGEFGELPYTKMTDMKLGLANQKRGAYDDD
jgi:hypothetical protein